MQRVPRLAWGILKQRLPLVLLALPTVFMTELLSRSGIGESISWGAMHFREFFFDSFIVGCILVLFIALIGRIRVAFWITAVLLLILSLISGIKLKMLGVPLLPWDFVLSGETGDMLQYLTNIVNFKLIGGLALFIAIGMLLLHKTKLFPIKVSWRERAVLAVISLSLLAVFYFDQPIPVKKWAGIESKPWDQGENVKENGFALTILMNTKIMFQKEKEGYSDAAIDAIVNQDPKPLIAGSHMKPNIIVVLSESFWDPTLIKGASFSRDPIPFFHKLQEKYAGGWMLSPQFGGGTANVEFEVLTGNSMRFLPQGSIPYNQFVTHEVDSLASITARQGYTSTAISPFHNWYFNSTKVYENFGFGKYIPIEFFKPHYEGPYIADSEVADNIIEETRKSAGPDFIFANTMENHFHFYPGKFPKNTIEVTGDMSPESKGMLETLSQGLIDADKMLKNLVEYYSKLEEPTIVVFFGDHLPYLGDDYQTYKDTKYISGTDDPDFLNKMYRVPVVVWNNYLPEQKDNLDISPSFLGSYILKLANLQGSYYTDYLSGLSQKIPVVPPKNYYEAMNIKEEDLKDYETLQYDILFGDRHGYKDFKDKIVNPNYLLGYGPMTLDSVTPDTTDISGRSEVTLTLKGTNIPPLGVVNVNGKPLPTTWENLTSVTAKVEGSLLRSGTWDIQVKVSDSKENVIGKSNILPLEMREN